jgi:hypothetical protein
MGEDQHGGRATARPITAMGQRNRSSIERSLAKPLRNSFEMDTTAAVQSNCGYAHTGIIKTCYWMFLIVFITSLIVLILIPESFFRGFDAREFINFLRLFFVELSRYLRFLIAFVIVVPICIVASLFAYNLRENSKMLYGIVEIFIGIVLAITANWTSLIIEFNAGQNDPKGVTFLQLVASVYIIVRGLDNIEKTRGQSDTVYWRLWDLVFKKYWPGWMWAAMVVAVKAGIKRKLQLGDGDRNIP